MNSASGIRDRIGSRVGIGSTKDVDEADEEDSEEGELKGPSCCGSWKIELLGGRSPLLYKICCTCARENVCSQKGSSKIVGRRGEGFIENSSAAELDDALEILSREWSCEVSGSVRSPSGAGVAELDAIWLAKSYAFCWRGNSELLVRSADLEARVWTRA